MYKFRKVTSPVTTPTFRKSLYTWSYFVQGSAKKKAYSLVDVMKFVHKSKSVPYSKIAATEGPMGTTPHEYYKYHSRKNYYWLPIRIEEDYWSLGRAHTLYSLKTLVKQFMPMYANVEYKKYE